ncbi:MAG: aminotransferase class III-fold pyridoxal phosphate-dependent enzyme [Chloroflexi bacterium]|nr:aminotransferase class III-fold pyridoxal phosphate-dependent enzyme [Chloroflexota bacterium]
MKHQGLSAEEIIRLNREHSLFSWSVQSSVNPIPVVGGKGVRFWDARGKSYIDFTSQLMNVNIGHQHPKVVQAIVDQANTLCYAYPGMATEPRGLLAKMLAEVAPGDLNKVFFTLGGAEANENAIKIARAYTGRHKIIARYRSYHGATYGAIAATGDPRRWPAEPAIPGVVHVLDPHCYRCPFGWTLETCRRECITHVDEVIQMEGPDQIAALLFEGVTGSNGIIVPPPDYWPRVREICDKYGIPLISDEVMSGFGRTGQWFVVNHWDVTPDMISTAKGITSGYLPLGAVIVSQRIADYFEDHMLWCGLTYSGHPLACAAGVATLQVYHEEGLIEHAAQMGRVLGQRLEDLKRRHPSVGDVRYTGFFSVIELVKNKATKEPVAPWNAKASEMGPMPQITKYLLDHGLFTYLRWNWLFVVPPLCITEEELDEGLAIVDQALAISDAVCTG